MCVSSFILPSALNNLISTPEDKQQSHYTVNVEIAGSAPVGSASNKNSNPVMNSGHKSHKSPPEATGRRRRGDRTVPKSDGSHDPWNSCYRQFQGAVQMDEAIFILKDVMTFRRRWTRISKTKSRNKLVVVGQR